MTLRNEGPVELLLLLSWPERERGQRPAALVPFGSRDSKESQPEERRASEPTCSSTTTLLDEYKKAIDLPEPDDHLCILPIPST